jgi:myo-inositol-1(or 4)-monophosphatase
MPALSQIIRILEQAGRDAGSAAFVYFREGATSTADVHYKDGNSPVTAADHAANHVLMQQLRQAFPDYALISEETPPEDDRRSRSHALILDPIDGTRGFIAGRPHWCVSIGLAVDGIAVAGVIHAPALQRTFVATQGGGAFLNGRRLPPRVDPKPGALTFSGPKPLVEAGARHFGLDPIHGPRLPSLALRFLEVATGEVDVAFASSGSHEWDSAAAACILAETGATLLRLDGEPIRFNQPVLRQCELVAAPSALMPDLIHGMQRHVSA